MVATLKYGIGQEVNVPVMPEQLDRLNETTVRSGLQDLLQGVTDDPRQAVPVLRQATADPRSVIEMKTSDGYVPLERETPFRTLMQDRENLEILISRPHAGG